MKLSAKEMEIIHHEATTWPKEFSIDIGINYHFYITTEEMDGREWWVIEPNKLDEDGCANPCGEKEFVPYSNYAELLITCEELAEKYFIEE